jgi:hypothetical protein
LKKERMKGGRGMEGELDKEEEEEEEERRVLIAG